MLDAVTDAIVLMKDDSGEMDARITLFTEKFGKLRAKGKSVKKITSKLSAHLEPGNVVSVRLVEKSGLHVADALKYCRLTRTQAELQSLDAIIHEAEPDASLWKELMRETFDWKNILAILGWDPKQAACSRCTDSNVLYFDTRSQDFYCVACGRSMDSRYCLTVSA